MNKTTAGRHLRKCVRVETNRSCVRKIKDGREIDRDRDRERDGKEIDNSNKRVTESNIR
jgi:hypothetical protein